MQPPSLCVFIPLYYYVYKTPSIYAVYVFPLSVGFNEDISRIVLEKFDKSRIKLKYKPFMLFRYVGSIDIIVYMYLTPSLYGTPTPPNTHTHTHIPPSTYFEPPPSLSHVLIKPPPSMVHVPIKPSSISHQFVYDRVCAAHRKAETFAIKIGKDILNGHTIYYLSVC
jgi:hypothetical protein